MTPHRAICREWQSDEPAHPPERRLCAAVLKLALEDLLGQSPFTDAHTPRACQNQKEAAQAQAFLWLCVYADGESRLSAQFCCQTVEYDIHRIRTWLIREHFDLMKSLKKRCLHG